MNFKEIFPLILNVLKDSRVIATAVVMLLVIEFAKYVVNYRKKPPRPVKIKKVAPPPKPKKEEHTEEEAEEEESEE